MPSTDFNSKPILILTVDEAKILYKLLMVKHDVEFFSLYNKVRQFLVEIENDPNNPQGAGVHQK